MPINIIKSEGISKIHLVANNVRSRTFTTRKESILTYTEDRVAYTDISEYESMIRKTCPR